MTDPVTLQARPGDRLVIPVKIGTVHSVSQIDDTSEAVLNGAHQIIR